MPRRFVLRTVRHGSVKVLGRIFRPSNEHLEYDGRLEGERLAFGLYPDFGEDVISLWGTEKEYKQRRLNSNSSYEVDGTLPWIWWKQLKEGVGDEG